MPSAAIIGAALTDHSERFAGLWVGGVDVSKEPGGGEPGYGVEEHTIEVSEVGPGGVSSMTFTIDDPNSQIEVLAGMDVRYEIFGNAFFSRFGPVFRGWVDSFTYTPAFGDQGRTIEVQCIGPEAFLDWSLTAAAFAIPVGTNVTDAIQTILGWGTGVNVPYRGFAVGGTTQEDSDYEEPISTVGSTGLTVDDITIAAGTTLRAAFQQLEAVSPIPQAVTMDFYLGVRSFDPIWNGIENPSDWNHPSFVGTSELNVTEDLAHQVTGATYRSVRVVGSGVALTVTDGSGFPGAMARLEDDTVTDEGTALAVGQQFLARNRTVPRGTLRKTSRNTYDLDDFGATHPGAQARLNNSRIGVSDTRYPITEIRRTFTGGGTLEDIEFTYGDLGPSFVRTFRRLTRGTIS